MMCVACGRTLTNDEQPNQAHWTLGDIRLPYCGDSDDCEWDAYGQIGYRLLPPRARREAQT